MLERPRMVFLRPLRVIDAIGQPRTQLTPKRGKKGFPTGGLGFSPMC